MLNPHSLIEDTVLILHLHVSLCIATENCPSMEKKIALKPNEIFLKLISVEFVFFFFFNAEFLFLLCVVDL